jgi:hypothetical protein
MAGPVVDHDRVLDVSEDDQRAYVQSSYRDYLRNWIRLRRALAAARASGDIESEARHAREIRSLWPRPEVIARAAGVLHLYD